MSLFSSKKSPVERFWKWFALREQKLFHHLQPASPLWSELSKRMQRVNETLTFEVSVTPDDDGQRELIISADGIRSAFKSVEELADAVPALRMWKIIRFRPPMPNYAEQKFEMHGKSVSCHDIQCALMQSGEGLIDVLMLIPGCPEPNSQDFAHIGFILLDTAIGEFDVECSVGDFLVAPPDFEVEHSHVIPFAEFRDAFYELRDQT